MVEHFAVERQLEVQFTAGEGEALADHRARLSGADGYRSVLDLLLYDRILLSLLHHFNPFLLLILKSRLVISLLLLFFCFGVGIWRRERGGGGATCACLHLADGHGDGRALVLLVVLVVANEDQEVVDNSDGAFRIIGAILEDDGCRSCRRKLEGERVGRGAQFLDQTLLPAETISELY